MIKLLEKNEVCEFIIDSGKNIHINSLKKSWHSRKAAYQFFKGKFLNSYVSDLMYIFTSERCLYMSQTLVMQLY